MARSIQSREIQPDYWQVWCHVTDNGSDYEERIGSVTKLGPRRFFPTTEDGKRLPAVDSLMVARIVLVDERDRGASAYRP